jgi:inosine-uridine nucleoside N-ribohydrolase
MRTLVLVTALFVMAPAPAPGAVPVWIDTEIGGDLDDAYALALALASPEIELRGITTVGGSAEDRAWMVCRLLTHVGRGSIPVAFGHDPQPDTKIDWQIQYRRHPAVVWNRTVKPAKESAVELMAAKLKASSEKVTIVALGPATNIARLLKEHPEVKPRIERIVLAPDQKVQDARAIEAVLESDVQLVFVFSPVAGKVKLNEKRQKELFAACTPLTYQLQTLSQLTDQPTPTLPGALSVGLLLKQEHFRMGTWTPIMGNDGRLAEEVAGALDAQVVLSVQTDDFLDFLTKRITSYGERDLPEPPKNVVQPVERGGLPNRVHAFEDYETDIEKRWWMTGKAVTDDVPPGSRRACRSVLTQDYDDRMGDRSTSYAAVVFNPVPGPPMGERTRLTFRYKLHGTDTLRVQLYSLSNGYHRNLSLKELPQGEWQTATVDMTQMRRPDGSGGPLAADERIDDIQFYIDPRAEVLIDDVVLYDAAPPGETRPFPERILFTGWFDTGKQGQEWPGEFEIVPHEKPRTWDAARSVVDKASGRPHLRIGLRGPRPLDELVRLRFRYQLRGDADSPRLDVGLVNTKTGATYLATPIVLQAGDWSEATIDFRIPDGDRDGHADELRLVAEPGAELLIDDLLLYVPEK